MDMRKVRPPGLGTRGWGSRGALDGASAEETTSQPCCSHPYQVQPMRAAQPSQLGDPGWMGAWEAPGDVPPSPPAAASAFRVSEGWGRADPQRAPGPLMDTPPAVVLLVSLHCGHFTGLLIFCSLSPLITSARPTTPSSPQPGCFVFSCLQTPALALEGGAERCLVPLGDPVLHFTPNTQSPALAEGSVLSHSLGLNAARGGCVPVTMGTVLCVPSHPLKPSSPRSSCARTSSTPPLTTCPTG